MVGNLTQSVRCTFYDGAEKYVIKNAPIGWDTLKVDIGRSKKTDGIMLDIIQDNEFVGLDAEYLKRKREQLGADGLIRYVFEVERFNNWEVFVDGFLELSSLKYDKTSVKIDYIDNDFDAVFGSNLKERFELDRLTDINDNPIDPLEKSTYIHKSREIFLRTDLEAKTTQSVIISSLTPYVSVPLGIDIISDNNIQETFEHTDGTYFVGYNTGDDTKTFPETQQFFYFENDRRKQIKVSFDLDFDFSFGVSGAGNQFFKLRLQKSLSDGEGNFTHVSLTNLHTINGDGSAGLQNFTYSNSFLVELDENECLCIVFAIPSGGAAKELIINKNDVRITEDSLFDPKDPEERKIDCLTITQAFERITRILSPTVQFKSDYISKNWKDTVLFSGETLRHVKYDGNKAPLVTLSFEELFETCFTLMGGIGYGIRKKGNLTVLEVEELDYFFDNEEGVYLGTLKDIETADNEDKIYSGVRLGFDKSGENEEVFGLQIGHTVNEYNLPVNTKENQYEAVCSAIVSPEEIELTFRKQYSQYPDEDSKRDKDFIVVDAFKKVSVTNTDGTNTIVTYHANIWQTHFSIVAGLYSINTAYNYRFLPANCLIRHAANFKQEFTTPYYATKKLAFKNTKGNADISTTLIGGVERPERISIDLSDLPRPLYGNKLIKGVGVSNYDVLKSIRAGRDKANYYRKFSYRDEQGIIKYGFMSTIKAEDDLKIELYNAI